MSAVPMYFQVAPPFVRGGDADFAAVNQCDAAATALGVIHEPAVGFGVIDHDGIGGIVKDRVAIKRTRGELACRRRIGRWCLCGDDSAQRHQTTKSEEARKWMVHDVILQITLVRSTLCFKTGIGCANSVTMASSYGNCLAGTATQLSGQGAGTSSSVGGEFCAIETGGC